MKSSRREWDASSKVLHTSRSLIFSRSPEKLRIDEDVFNPEEVKFLEVIADRIVVPREAMGLGDVKFMAAIGAFLGWPAVVFSLMVSSVIGSAVSLLLILFKCHAWSNRIPYGPYIALAATLWILGAREFLRSWLTP